jgi:hypothetical protein
LFSFLVQVVFDHSNQPQSTDSTITSACSLFVSESCSITADQLYLPTGSATGFSPKIPAVSKLLPAGGLGTGRSPDLGGNFRTPSLPLPQLLPN